MIGRRVFFILASTAALSACAVAHHRAPDLTLPAAYEAPAGSQMLSSHQLDDWWLFFRDPELDRLEQQAFTFSPDAKTAAARLLEAHSTMQAATSATLPTGSITGNVSRQSEMNLLGSADQLLPIGGVTDTQQLNFNVSWELDFFGRLRTERRIAKADFAASRFDIAAAWASLAANVATDYFQAKGLAIQLDDAQTNADISAHLYD
ncbi:MAG: TolC family protein, partial [Caulobacteraceae bacterium]